MTSKLSECFWPPLFQTNRISRRTNKLSENLTSLSIFSLKIKQFLWKYHTLPSLLWPALILLRSKQRKVIWICQTGKKIFFQDQAQYVWKWKVNAFCKTIQSCPIGLVWPNMTIKIKSEYMYGTYREFWESEISDTKLQRCETIMIMHLDQHILSFLEKGCQELLICILAKLTATKKNISCQNMSLLWNSSVS